MRSVSISTRISPEAVNPLKLDVYPDILPSFKTRRKRYRGWSKTFRDMSTIRLYDTCFLSFKVWWDSDPQIESQLPKRWKWLRAFRTGSKPTSTVFMTTYKRKGLAPHLQTSRLIFRCSWKWRRLFGLTRIHVCSIKSCRLQDIQPLNRLYTAR